MSRGSRISWICCVLDKLFENKKLSVWIPLATAAVMYVLFLIFGDMPEKWQLALGTMIVAPIWYGGVYLVFLMQIQNPGCPAKFLDIFLFAAVFVFGFSAVSMSIQFLADMKNNFSASLITGLESWSVFTLVHYKHKQE